MRNFKVILGNGGFYAVGLTAEGSEAHASEAERRAAADRLLREVGMAAFQKETEGGKRLPGLTEDEAKRLAFRLSRARMRTAARQREQQRGRRRA